MKQNTISISQTHAHASVFGCLFGTELSRASVRAEVDVRDAFNMLKACKQQNCHNQYLNIYSKVT